ncbi:Acyltransferase 3 domain-containing protein [Nostoc sp. DSM 114161]|jgi:peptidoglycan/LPS O-acetylase OafA/YrhL|uniref:acyltransferase family protein n=1 Tax=Nostoc sp. DSM 114161 TaxID=3440143 RepID=UPI004045DFDA
MLKSSPNVKQVSSIIRGYMPVLNGYRGIAILLVFLRHCISEPAAERINFVEKFYTKLMFLGWCGVDAFFVLSGFLITGILLDSREKPNYFKNFYARRMLRIFPAYYVFLSIFLGIIHPLIRSYESLNHIDSSQIWYWFYLQNWYMIFRGDFLIGPISHLWSLAIEEQFYLICPALIYFLPRRLLDWFFGTVILSAVFFRSWLLLTHPLTDNLFSSIFVNPVCRVDALTIGSLIALWMRSDRILPRLLSISPILLIVSAISLGIMEITQGGLDILNPVLESIGFSILAIFFGSLLILSVTQSENSLLVKCLSWSPLQGLGTISYGFYIYHFPILWMFCDRIYEYMGYSFIVGHLATVLFCGVLTLSVSLVSWYCLEQPILRLKTYFSSNPENNLSSSVNA